MNLLDIAPSHAAGRIAAWLRDRGAPAYRERQIFPRLWQRPVAAWADATPAKASSAGRAVSLWPASPTRSGT